MDIDPINKSSEGRFFGIAKVGEKGQIVIPKPARDMFSIKPGDDVVVLADINRGIAIMRADVMQNFAEQIMGANFSADNEETPDESDRNKKPD